MTIRTGTVLAALAAAGVLAGTAVGARAGELGFLEMLFGMRPAAPEAGPAEIRRVERAGAARHRLRTRYSALPVRIRVTEPRHDGRQTPIDMSGGATAALLKDPTLRPGDIVVFDRGARVFTGEPDKRHSLRDFEPAQTSPLVGRTTRKLLAGMVAPVGALPADEARRMLARLRRPAAQAGVQTTAEASPAAAMRVISPWRIQP